MRLAWNGASLRVPGDWEPARLGKSYLFLEDGTGPVLECKWTAAKKQLSPDAAVKRLARESGARIEPIEENALRPAWKKALADADHAAFAWKSPHMEGLGAVFRPDGGGPLTVLRFYRPLRPEKDAGEPFTSHAPIWDEVLGSYRRHDGEERAPFELYGIRLLAPQGRALKTFSFKPGAFEIEFEGGRESLTYARFAPAEAILRGKTLEGWTRAAFSLGNNDSALPLASPPDHADNPAMLFASPGPGNPLYRGLLRAACAVSGRKRFTGGIVRHYLKHNRILCLTARGTRPISPERLAALEKDYGTF